MPGHACRLHWRLWEMAGGCIGGCWMLPAGGWDWDGGWAAGLDRVKEWMGRRVP